MKRKKTAKAAPVQPAPPDYLPAKDVFAAFVAAASSIGNEVMARRAFADEVAAYLTEKGLITDFEAWRKARAEAPRGV